MSSDCVITVSSERESPEKQAVNENDDQHHAKGVNRQQRAIAVSSDWAAREKQSVNEKDDLDHVSSTCNAKLSNRQRWISIAIVVILLVVVLGAGLSLVRAQNDRLREMERDHQIRMKLHDLCIKGIDHSRAIDEMNARVEEQKQIEKTNDRTRSRAIDDMETPTEEQKQSVASRKVMERERRKKQ